jgi:hypothetical protein
MLLKKFRMTAALTNGLANIGYAAGQKSWLRAMGRYTFSF